MATVNELTVKISADVKTAIDGLNKATDSLKDFGANGAKSISEVNAALAELRKQRNIATTSEEVNRLNKAIKDLSAEAARLRKPAEELGKKILPQVAQGSSQANFALTNTGRVLQDLPFGAIGVANNLEPLVQSFVQLRKESGSVKGAISALAGSLLGGGGLVLAISLVSAGLSLWGQRQQKLNREAKEGAEQANKYAEELAKERVQLDLLFKAATSANVPLSKRKEAIKELRSQYGEYLKDFSNEEILAGKAASAYNQLANAITQAARARALQERITENERKALELEIKATEEALAVRNKANAQKNETIRISGGVGAAVEVEVKAVDKQRDIYRQGAKAIRDYTNEAKELREENLRLANQYTKTLPAAFTATEKAQKSQSEKAKKSAKETSAFFGTLGTKDLPKVTSGIDKLAAKFETITPTTANIKKKFAELDSVSLNNAFQATDILAQSIFTTFEGLERGESIFRGLGDAVKALVSQLAQAAVKALIFQAILAAVPGLGVAAGKGGFLGRFLQFAGFQGFSPNATTGGIAINLQGGFRVQGRDLVAVLANQQQFTNRRG